MTNLFKARPLYVRDLDTNERVEREWPDKFPELIYRRIYRNIVTRSLDTQFRDRLSEEDPFLPLETGAFPQEVIEIMGPITKAANYIGFYFGVPRGELHESEFLSLDLCVKNGFVEIKEESETGILVFLPKRLI